MPSKQFGVADIAKAAPSCDWTTCRAVWYMKTSRRNPKIEERRNSDGCWCAGAESRTKAGGERKRRMFSPNFKVVGVKI
uniref:Uncharacterized protein n=1 Tax=Kalanchoe fedtschenkoi TaxID=63787 RepID=A0A7N0U046_KALFE